MAKPLASESRSVVAWSKCAEDAIAFSAVGFVTGVATSLVLVRKPHTFLRGVVIGGSTGVGVGRAWARCNSVLDDVEASRPSEDLRAAESQ